MHNTLAFSAVPLFLGALLSDWADADTRHTPADETLLSEATSQIAEHPMAALLVAGLLGYGLGLLIHGRD